MIRTKYKIEQTDQKYWRVYKRGISPNSWGILAGDFHTYEEAHTEMIYDVERQKESIVPPRYFDERGEEVVNS